MVEEETNEGLERNDVSKDMSALENFSISRDSRLGVLQARCAVAGNAVDVPAVVEKDLEHMRGSLLDWG